MTGAVCVERIADGLHRTSGADVDLAFRIQGVGPAVVLLHGTSANHAVWEPVAERLASTATVIALDQRGHGRSDKPARGYAGPDFAGDVVSVLDALGIDRAVVAGHSLGGRNAWLAGALHPDRVAAVLSVDYTPYVEASVLDDLALRVAGGHRGFESVEQIRGYLRERYPRILPAAVDRRARWGYEKRADGLWWPLAAPDAMSQLIAGFRTPWDAEFRAVQAPMVGIRGGRSRIVSSAAWAAAIAARPADRWVDVDEADHYIPEEFPDLVADELDRLIAESLPSPSSVPPPWKGTL
ncbi:pimeloyl-ACP methyl ester carboxylesterase [Microbacterium sp. AG790]|uniref:alpha/beta fold hydrolase n=1 Tax=Microbacterium sp. AG790 TaxID=2183995 RepID=UPI000EB2741F|nr:alpha/beta hydrolase [Microbacterium sp. AG790]RKS92999.1 pimeloyl-ACP methyl ester carboxylesterase [Microbacterium sp. AG790]